jgi:hypothetical protein
MIQLPKWLPENPFPAIHDFESLTAIEQTARINGAMNQLICEYNKMLEYLAASEESEQESREEFELKITKVIREFMCSWEQKTADIERFAETIINEAIQTGKITITEVYDPETESLDLIVGGEV